MSAIQTEDPGAVRGGTQRFLVTVSYREPTFAASTGIEEQLYSWSLPVAAEAADAAIRRALEAFDQMFLASNVGWSRDVVDVVARRATDDAVEPPRPVVR